MNFKLALLFITLLALSNAQGQPCKSGQQLKDESTGLEYEWDFRTLSLGDTEKFISNEENSNLQNEGLIGNGDPDSQLFLNDFSISDTEHFSIETYVALDAFPNALFRFGSWEDVTEIKGAVDLNNNPFLRVCDGLPKEEGEMCDVWFFTKDDELIELDTQKMYHWVFVFNQSQLQVYVDGEPVFEIDDMGFTVPQGTRTDNLVNLKMWSGNWKGTSAFLRIYGQSLTAGDISTLYSSRDTVSSFCVEVPEVSTVTYYSDVNYSGTSGTDVNNLGFDPKSIALPAGGSVVSTDCAGKISTQSESINDIANIATSFIETNSIVKNNKPKPFLSNKL